MNSPQPATAGVGSLDPEALLAAPGRHGRVPEVGIAVARRVVEQALRLTEGGTLTIVEGSRRRRLGGAEPDRYGRTRLEATIEVLDPRFFTAVASRGSSGLGESYRRGWWRSDDLPAVLRLASRSLRRVEPLRRGLRRAQTPIREVAEAMRRPDRDRDRANIAAHYDLGNDFFRLFLDPTLTYSAALFDSPEMSLEDASTAKLDRLCRGLGLTAGSRVMEIGTGWGSFALHAAGRYGAQVVTTTLSAEQHRLATERVAAAGLSNLVEVRNDHYRDCTGEFDAVVAIEMIEAVHWREVPDLLEHCARLAAPDGAVGLQAIVSAPRRRRVARSTHDFITTHVFPGGSLPSVPAIVEAASDRSDLLPVDLHDFGLHYAETLRRWRSTLARRRDEALDLGVDEEMLRLWDFYFAYCEAGFEERMISVVQMVFERPGRAPSLLRPV